MKQTPYNQNTHGIHFIYILECENNTIYVGTTRNLFNRMCRHFSLGVINKTSSTVKNKPISLISVYEGGYYEENALSKILAQKYKNKKVLGGAPAKASDDSDKIVSSLKEKPNLCDTLNFFIIEQKKIYRGINNRQITPSERGVWLRKQIK